MFRLAVLVSGNGSNLQQIIENIENQNLKNCKIEYVIADRECYAINRAIKHNIQNYMFDRNKYGDKLSNEINKVISNNVDYIVLAGYLSILSEKFIETWKDKIINIHPSLLPKYGGYGMYGMKVHNAVIANNEKESGCTVHFVDNGVDTGKILLQEKVDINENETPETLQKKVLEKEHILLIKSIKMLIGGQF